MCILTLFIGISAARAETWNLASDFSIIDNPSGDWTYGWFTIQDTALNNYDSVESSYQWYDSDHHSGDYTPTIWKDNGSGEIGMHPGWDGSLSVARWTSTSSGEIAVSGYFGAGDSGAMSYYIYENNVLSYEWTNDAGTETFSFSLTVVAGDTIDFCVGTGSDGYSFGTTPVSVTITTVPEPGCLSLVMSGGLLAVVAVGTRRRRAYGHFQK